ncbi:porin [Rhodohalobacter sp. SW132]|uniref:porin n=1 Tax=Rhodohalobacter sp. SW132 TaxID=2293433 RepID=UPI001314E175|nr:porin [Rhodohalobacter sp. SW132]
MKCTKILLTYLFALILVTILFNPHPVTAQNGTSFTTDTGWDLNVNGALPVFTVLSSHENFSSDGQDQFATRVMSGFNPANVTFTVDAPTQNGLDVSAIFQINHHLHGPGVQNSGLFEGRIAEIQISGSFGTINAGKGFGVFNSSSIGDEGSGMGVGRFAGPDAADATLGRIGSGYTYANFNPRIIYTTPNLNGFTLKGGLFNPEKPGGANSGIETPSPRLEAQVDYRRDLGIGSLQVWAGGLHQQVDVLEDDFTYNFSGWDTGAQFTIAGLTLTGSYSETNSIGADGLIGINISGGDPLDQADVDGTQWYTEATYKTGRFLLGASYGEGSQDSITTDVGSSNEVTNKLLMGFARYSVTDILTLMAEVQTFESESQANYSALILGTQITF